MATRRQGGYSCKFVQEPPTFGEFKCPVCSLVLRDPHLTTCCGRNACESCIPLKGQRQDAAAGGINCCPLCGGQLSAVKNRNLNNEIQALETYCSYSGCDWKGKLESYEKHLGTCEFAVIPCQYCEERTRRRDLATHKQTCVRYPLTCKACGITMERRNYHAHTRKECPLVTVACPFAQFGCEQVAQRKDLRAHFDSALEYHLAVVRGVSETTAAESRRKKDELIASEAEKFNERDLEIAKLQQSVVKTEQKSKALQKLIVDAEKEMEHLVFEQGLNREEFARGMAQRDAEMVRLRQSIEQLREQMKAKCYGPPLPRYAPNAIQSRPHPPVQVEHLPPLSVTITNYSTRMWNNEIWRSPPFYTHRFGYKMCLVVYTNGFGNFRGVWVSVYVSLVRGEYDHCLSWPYSGKVTLTVYNKARNAKHVNETVNFRGNNCNAGEQVTDGHLASTMWGIEKFLIHRTLNPINPFSDQRYLKNDCLEIHIKTSR